METRCDPRANGAFHPMQGASFRDALRSDF
jgi:hypothetical protein